MALVLAAPAPATAQTGVCTNGSARLGNGTAYPCSNVDLLARLSPQQLGVTPSGGVFHNSLWGWADPTTGREYAVVGNADGTRFVDVTTPTAPLYLGLLPTATGIVLWREVRVTGNLAVIVSEASGHGLQIFDLTRLRGLGADPARRFTATARYTGFGSAHNVVVTEGAGGSPTVYGVGSQGGAAPGLPAACNVPGFHAVDLSVPTAPTFVGCFSDGAQETGPVAAPGYTHDAQCMVYRGTDADYAGREVCFASNEDVVTIFDVTDKANVRVVSQASYPDDAYTHQGALTSDGRYFLVDDELDEQNGLTATARTIVMDFQDLDDPEVAFIYNSALPVIDHNQYVVGNRVYQSNYEAGLRVLSLDDIGAGQLTEVGFFDTYPQGQGLGFNGQWTNYPSLPSGTVLANDIQNGLFVLRLTGAAVAGEPGPGAAAGGLALGMPAPNPTASESTLRLTTSEPQAVRAVLVDVLGREVAVLFDGTADGDTDLVVRRGTLPAGTYVVRATGERGSATRTVVIAG